MLNSDMKNMKNEPDLQQLYDQDLYNRYYIYKNVNQYLNRAYGFKLLVGNSLLILKLALSRFVKPAKLVTENIFIAWSSLHKSRSKDLSESYELVEYNRFLFSKKQICYFSSISIREFLQLLLKINKSYVAKFENSDWYVTDTFQYRILFVLEYLVLKGIIFDAKK